MSDETRTTGWTSSWELVRQALWRSRIIIAAAVWIGAVAMVAYGALAGPLYEASAEAVLAAPTANEAAPERRTETQGVIAQSTGFQALLATRLGVSRDDVRRRLDTVVEPGADVLQFTARGDSERKALELANAAADAFPGFLRTLGQPAARPLSRAEDATRIRPAPVRDAILGAVLGLVAGLLVAGAREAFTRRIRNAYDVEEHLSWPVLLDLTSDSVPADVAFERLALTLERSVGDPEPHAVLLASTSRASWQRAMTTRLCSALARGGASVAVVGFDRDAAVAESELGPAAVALHGAQSTSLRLQESSVRNAVGLHEALPDHDADWLVINAPPMSRSALADQLSQEVDWTLLVVVRGETTRGELELLSRRSSGWYGANHGVILVDR